MAQAPWKSLIQDALRKNAKLRHSRYLQIATVRPDGRPANRSVVYRGFLGETDRLTFVTDIRSNKIEDLAKSPWAEIAWYFPESREQYRLLGRVTVVTHAVEDPKLVKARLSAWKQMSDPGRQQFLWPEPGLPRPPEESDDAVFKPPAPGQNDPVAEPFCLCIMDVEEVDHLHLAKNQRHVYKKSSSSGGVVVTGQQEEEENGTHAAVWNVEFVNP